jgi:hypothetical protein
VLKKSVDSGDCHRVALSSELLQYCFGGEALTEVVRPYFDERPILDEVFPVLAYEFLGAKTSVSPALLRSLASTRQRALDVGVALATCVARDNGRRHLKTLREFVDIADVSVLTPLFYVAGQVHPSVIPALCEKGALPEYHETTLWLCHKWGEASRTKPAGVITLQAIQEAARAVAGHIEERPKLVRSLLAIRGMVYFEEDAVLRTTSGGAADRSAAQEAIPSEVRKTLISESRLSVETYERVKAQLGEIRYTIPDLPAFFEGDP